MARWGKSYNKHERAVRSKLRHAALAAGETFYLPPFPCRHGHIGPWLAKGNTCVACNADSNARWWRKDMGTSQVRRRERYLRNMDNEKTSNKRWADSNRDKVNAKERNRRAQKKASIGQHTAADIVAIRAAQRNRCAYCRVGLRGVGHVDHIIPLVLGGGNGRENLQLLCQPCNSSKGGKHPVEFAQFIGRLL